MLIILSYSVTTICLFSPCIFLSSHLLYYYGDGHECYSLSYNLSLWLRLQFVAQIIPALGVFSGWLLCVPLIFFSFCLALPSSLEPGAAAGSFRVLSAPASELARP